MKQIIPALYLISSLFFFSCSTGKFIAHSATELQQADGIRNAHLGISIYNTGTKKSLYNYQADKYFIPASNAKLFTLFAGLTYLRDSLPGLKYMETADSFFIMPTGDPSFLHPYFQQQPIVEKLQKIEKPIFIVEPRKAITPYGMGWAWDDYNSDYMAERSALPVYGNVIRWTQSAQVSNFQQVGDNMETLVFSEPDVNWKVRFIEDRKNKTFRVNRRKDENYFEIHQGNEPLAEQSVPFITNGLASALELLKDTIHHEIIPIPEKPAGNFQTWYSQPADSLYKRMMHESDNFFAEQVLLMAAGQALGVMDQEKIIDSLLKNQLKSLPQRPRWVDGSGLSRYNLFTPADFVWLLNMMKEQFGLERLKGILTTGNEGTLSGYYTSEKGHIYAKTGTLTSNVALSGFLITRKNTLLIFSVQVNNHQSSATAVRRQVEKFLTGIINKY